VLRVAQLGSTAVGIQVPDGVLLAVEKRITSPLLEPDSIEKIMEIDSHIGCSMSGLTADARTLIDHARIETQNHRFTYDSAMTIEATTQSICDLALGFGEGAKKQMVSATARILPAGVSAPALRCADESFSVAPQSRPYGVALLLAGVDDKDGPVLYHTDPSGTFVRFKAKAIGSGSEGAQTNLQEALADGTDVSHARRYWARLLQQLASRRLCFAEHVHGGCRDTCAADAEASHGGEDQQHEHRDRGRHEGEALPHLQRGAS